MGKVVIQCCRCNPPGCPTILLDTDINSIEIQDDFNGTCRMTCLEFEDLVSEYERIKNA
jgi:hypothetical protein